MRAVSEPKNRRTHVRSDTTRLAKETHQEARYLRSNYLQNPQTTSGGMETFIRTLTGPTRYIPDHLL